MPKYLTYMLLFLLGISLTSCNLYYDAFYTDPDEFYALALEKEPFDVVIIPGFPSDSGEINTMLAERVEWANHIYTTGLTKNIIFSGSSVYTPYYESKIMKAYALQTEIDPDHIFVETRAEHTTENVYYSYLLAKEMGFEKIGFSTQTAQSSFMRPFRRKFKLDFEFLPIVSDSLDNFPFKNDFINTQSAKNPDFVSLVEREGFFQRLKGTRGKKVRKDMKQRRKMAKKELPAMQTAK